MSKQWVDITTLDNRTPFGKVRWLENLTIAQNTSDFLEFSELSGITIDNRYWYDNAGPNWGYASTHRTGRGDNSFTCTFLNQYRTTNDVSVTSGSGTAGTAVHDVRRTQFYDNIVVIDGQTFYEVDFTTWDGYVPLYYCYTGTSVSAGQVYVEVDAGAIKLDKDSMKFVSTGGSDTVLVTADDNWTAVVSDNWITASTLSGASGQTTVTITTPDYQDTTTNRTGTIEFTCSGDTVILTVTQKKVVVPGSIGNVYLGDLDAEGMYLGDLEVEAMYLGDSLIFPTGPFQGIKLKPSSMAFAYTGGTGTLQIKSSTGWTLSYDSNYIAVSQASGSSGDSTVQITALTNSTQADINTEITATTTDLQYSASTNVTIHWNMPLPQKPFMFNYNAKEYDQGTYTFPKTQGQLFNEDLVLDQAPTNVSADCVSFVGSTAVMTKAYNTSSDNPFNRYYSDVKFTAIYKVGSFTANEQTLFGNRGSGYNYMIRGIQFHTSSGSFLSYTPATDPYIMLVRVQDDRKCERSVLDVNGNVLQQASATPITWGSASDKICFFSEYGWSQYFNGILYWMYLSNDALTDSEVLQVINYNENIVQPPQPVVTPTGFTKCAYADFNPQPGEYYTFASQYSDSKWYVPTTDIGPYTAIASDVTYGNNKITNLPSDLLFFEIESVTGGYRLKQAGTNQYLQINGNNISLGSNPGIFEFGNTIYDSNGNSIGTSSDAAVMRYGNSMALTNTYVSGDPDPLYAREFMFDGLDSSKAPFIAKLFKAD